MSNRTYIHILAILALTLLAACRSDEYVIYSEDQDTGVKMDQTGDIVGMYVLNEGNMGSNKCTLDYLDLSGSDETVHYTRNIYSERNPNEVKELGDVGNDIQTYGSKLWMVVNCSNKVEVAEASTCKKVGKIDIPNCRYVTFDGGYAYVSSYVGPVQLGGKAQLGRVYKVDTLTLAKVDSVTVGYQPEEMAIVGGKMYVTNSGGYRATGDYDRTVSQIDMASFTEERKIDVAINPHRCRADRYGQVWVSSRGDYGSTPSRLYWMDDDGGLMEVEGMVDVVVSDMCIAGDTLYYIGIDEATNATYTGMVNVATHKQITSSLSSSAEFAAIQVPYGIIVNPIGKDFYLMDAKDYVSSGELLHFASDGTFDWKVRTGDIPSRAVFLRGKALSADDGGSVEETKSRYMVAVDEYVPAPGQFVNVYPAYEEGDDAATMARKCTDLIANDAGGLVTLGGYGGYITFHFDHSVTNVEGERDLYIKGNAYNGNSEPGIVMVSRDANGNGLPDDEWYELRGSADNAVYNYEITYTFASLENTPWTDNQGNTGYVYRNAYHQQEYYPQWLTDKTLTFKGTRLPDNATYSNNIWTLSSFDWGYVDNKANSDTDGCSFDIDWAVDADRNPVKLESIDFVRVYNAMNQTCGWLGETSTEICGAEDLYVE